MTRHDICDYDRRPVRIHSCDVCGRPCTRIHHCVAYGTDTAACDDCAGYEPADYDEQPDPLLTDDAA